MRHRIRGSALAAAAILGLAFISMPATGGAAKRQPKKPKPQLVVRELTFQSSPSSKSSGARFPHVVIQSNKNGRFGLVFTIKNIDSRPSHNSHARIFISGKDFDSQLVGPIGARKARTVRETYNPSFKGPGVYDVSVCVEGNSCSKHVRFSVVPQSWDVNKFTTGPNSLTGFAPFFAAQSEGLKFDFHGIINDNDDFYFLWLATGVVTADVTGNDGFCTYSGHGAVGHSQWDVIPPDVGYLEISIELDSYFAEVKDDNHAFVATQTCPGYPPNDSEHPIFSLETIGLDGRVDRSMSSSAKTLADSYTIPTGFGSGSTVGAWSFRADLP